MHILEITPRPTEDEAAAIALALEELWPKPAAPQPEIAPDWRFASRWWNKRALG